MLHWRHVTSAVCCQALRMERSPVRIGQIGRSVVVEKDVEQGDEVFRQRLAALLGRLGDAGAAIFRDEVQQINCLFQVGDLVRLGLVEGVELLDRLGLEEHQRVDEHQAVCKFEGSII